MKGQGEIQGHGITEAAISAAWQRLLADARARRQRLTVTIRAGAEDSLALAALLAGLHPSGLPRPAGPGNAANLASPAAAPHPGELGNSRDHSKRVSVRFEPGDQGDRNGQTVPQGPRLRALVAGRPLPGLGELPVIKAADYPRYLGSTLDLLVFDSFSGLALDALAALCGCVAGGGALLWLLPPDHEVAGFLDPECQRLFAYPSRPQDSRQVYLRYLGQRLAGLAGRLDVHGEGGFAVPGEQAVQPTPTATRCAWTLSETPFDTAQVAPTADIGGNLDGAFDAGSAAQQQAVEAILELVHSTSEKWPTLVLTADRGRGKSAALGMAAGRLLVRTSASGPACRLVVTAHHPAVTSTLFHHARLEAAGFAAPTGSSGASDQTEPANRSTSGADAGLVRQSGHLSPARLNLANGASLAYRAPDDLLTQPEPCDLLLIDEAATLPIPVLARLLTHYSRVVMATTMSGHEGTGQGFRLKFLPTLQALRPGWRHLQLTTPIRWASGDPLERFVNRVLLGQEYLSLESTGKNPKPAPRGLVPLPHQEQAGADPPAHGATTGPRCRLLDWERNLREGVDPGQVLALLALAHYRTTPEDLRVMLDSPALDTFGIELGGDRVGVILVAREDPITDPALIAAIERGERRPRGLLTHLTLAQQVGLGECLALPVARIVRIVIAPEKQRRHLASDALRELRHHYAGQGRALLTASFSLFPDVSAFWRANDFALLRIGLQRDAVTATHSLLTGVALSPQGEALLAKAGKRCAERFPHDLAMHFTAMDDEALLAVLAYFGGRFCLSRDERDLVYRFACGALSYESVEDLLQKLAFDALAHATLCAVDLKIWMARVIRQHDWQRVARHSAVPGRATLIQVLRRSALHLLNYIPKENHA